MMDNVVRRRADGSPTPDAVVGLLCNADGQVRAARCGFALRDRYYVDAAAGLVRPRRGGRVAGPRHGHFPARLARPSRWRRLVAWWRSVDWSLWCGLGLSVAFLLYLLWEVGR